MALRFSVLAECPVTKARAASMVLCHHTVETPVFMPVGTQGSLKGMTSQQLAVGLSTECQIMLGNTYHLANKPVSKRSTVIVDCCCVVQGCAVLEKAGGLHNFMDWQRGLLTVS